MTKASKAKAERATVPMLNQMLLYCEWQEMEGSYYGNKEHFQNRHKRIVAWLEANLAALTERKRKGAG